MTIKYEKNDGVALITLDNPPVNVFTPSLHRQFFAVLEDFVTDRSVRVGVLTGAGDRAFCAGDDIRSPRPERTNGQTVERHLFPRSDEDAPEYPGWEHNVLGMKRYKPIVGAVNGPCYGIGLVYLLHLTDIRIAASTARFGFPEIRHGMGGAGGITRLGRTIPHTVAMHMLLTGEDYTADMASKVYLVNESVPPDQVLGRAFDIAEQIAEHPPIAVRVEMEAYEKGMNLSASDAIAFSNHLYRLERLAFDNSVPLEDKKG